jgi:DNA-directed RNA polymerase specialized sigma24 family protein
MLITRRRIADQFQNRRKSAVSHISASSDAVSIASRAPVVSLRDDTTRTSTANRVPDPATFSLEACWEEQWQKNLVELAMEKARNLVSPKQFQMFELYTLREWPVEKVAKALGVSAGQVYLAKHRVSALVKKEARKLEKSGSCGPHRSRAPL